METQLRRECLRILAHDGDTTEERMSQDTHPRGGDTNEQRGDSGYSPRDGETAEERMSQDIL